MSTHARAVIFCLALIVVALLCSTRVASVGRGGRSEIAAVISDGDTGRPHDPLRWDAGVEPEPPRLEPIPFDAGIPPRPRDSGAPVPLAFDGHVFEAEER